jgi:hypothetical protein
MEKQSIKAANRNQPTQDPYSTMKRLILILFPMYIAAALCLTGQAQTQAASEPDDLRAVLEMLRSDMNSYKIRTLNQVMALTAPEAEAFWPVYRQYEKELAAVGDRKLSLIREYAAMRTRGSMDSKSWDSLAQRWLTNVQDRLDLWKKYQKKIGKSVSPMRAAQFLQVEHQIALFIDLNIASEMPVIGVAGPAK